LKIMCDRLKLLAQLDHRRWMSCCEHGTVHLAWDSVSLRLNVQRVRGLAEALKSCAQVARHFRIAASHEVCVVYDEYDLYQVWVNGVGLCLSPADFQLFCRLFSEAADHEVVRDSDTRANILTGTSPIRTTFHLFSVN
jgi:hypothetical protein